MKTQELKKVTSDFLSQEYYKNDLESQIIESSESDWIKFKESLDFCSSFCGGVVYILHMCETNFYKIGISSSYNGLQNRITSIKTASLFDIEIVTYILLEKGISENASFIESFLHTQLKKFRVKREWFNLTEDQLFEIYSFMCFELDILEFSPNEHLDGLFEFDEFD